MLSHTISFFWMFPHRGGAPSGEGRYSMSHREVPGATLNGSSPTTSRPSPAALRRATQRTSQRLAVSGHAHSGWNCSRHQSAVEANNAPGSPGRRTPPCGPWPTRSSFHIRQGVSQRMPVTSIPLPNGFLSG